MRGRKRVDGVVVFVAEREAGGERCEGEVVEVCRRAMLSPRRGRRRHVYSGHCESHRENGIIKNGLEQYSVETKRPVQD